MTAGWIAETVRAFGRQLGLQDFALNDRGAAALRFENGLSLHLELAGGDLLMSVGFAADGTARTQQRLLAAVHPAARTGIRMRAIRLEKSGEARLVARLGERELTTTALEACFRALWTAADNVRRAVS